MTVYLIETLLAGTIDPDIERQITAKLPMILREVERTNEHAPDYCIDAGGRTDAGYGWSRSSKSGIPFINFLIEHSEGVLVAGVAFQSPDHAGRWIAQLQDFSTVRIHA